MGEPAPLSGMRIIDVVSLLHLHIARGKRSVVLDLRQPAGVAVFLDLVARADELPFPARIDGVVPRRPEPAPRPGEHAGQVLREVLGYDAQRVAALRGQGVLG